MKTMLICAAGCLLVGSLIWTTQIGGQQPSPVGAPPPPPQAYIANLPPVPAVAAKPATKSVEQLLDSLENIRKQKAELEIQENAVIAELKQKLNAQQERLQKLGVNERIAIEPKPKDDERKKDEPKFGFPIDPKEKG